jgi:hypothetical protein
MRDMNAAGSSTTALPGLILAAAVALLALPLPLAADEYLPLNVGNFWEYESTAGDPETQLVTGTTELWGTEVYTIEFVESSVDEGLVNFWTSGEDGDADLWGFFRSDVGWGILYNPPLRMVDAPLWLDKWWSNEFDTYSLPDTTYLSTDLLWVGVTEEGPLTVPAGTFPTFGISPDEGEGPGIPNESYTVLGQRVAPDAARYAFQWYSDGVGIVQYGSSGLFQLTSYFVSTPVERESWGRIKGLFRE